LAQKNLNRLIYRIAEISSRAGEGHVPSALSILDIVWIIYNDFININLVKKKSEKRDISFKLRDTQNSRDYWKSEYNQAINELNKLKKKNQKMIVLAKMILEN
jgi:hypothetical protein